MAVPFPIVVVAIGTNVLLQGRELLSIDVQGNVHAVDGHPVAVSLDLKHDVIGSQRAAVKVGQTA